MIGGVISGSGFWNINVVYRPELEKNSEKPNNNRTRKRMWKEENDKRKKRITYLVHHMIEEEVSLWDPKGLEQNSLASLQIVLFQHPIKVE